MSNACGLVNCALARLDRMNPAKVDRRRLACLTDLPNVGPSIAGDLQLIGINHVDDLIGRDPYVMYAELNSATHVRHDPCVIDVFISITRIMDGESPRPWWDYTAERKERLANSDSE
jgi:hypothetical protein